MKLGGGGKWSKEMAAQKRLAALLNYKLKQEYSEMCGFVKARMSLVIVVSNSLLLHGILVNRVSLNILS